MTEVSRFVAFYCTCPKKRVGSFMGRYRGSQDWYAGYAEEILGVGACGGTEAVGCL